MLPEIALELCINADITKHPDICCSQLSCTERPTYMIISVGTCHMLCSEHYAKYHINNKDSWMNIDTLNDISIDIVPLQTPD